MSAPPLQSPPSATSAKVVVVPVSSSGRAGTAIFFGSLCVGTFTLGVWQCQRYLEKQVLEEQRSKELQQDPVPINEYCRSIQQQQQQGTNSTTSTKPSLLKSAVATAL